MPTRLLLALSIFIAAFSFFTFSYLDKTKEPHIPNELIAVLKPNPIQLTDFSLTDHNNEAFDLKRLYNNNTLLFFGYTSCPDICPTTLTTINLVYKNLKTKDVNVVFVSVDPERDKTENLADYVQYFNKNFIGVTGTKASVDELTQQFKAGYVIEEATSEGSYLVSHTSSIFLVDPQAKIIASFSPPHHADVIASQLETIFNLANSTTMD